MRIPWQSPTNKSFMRQDNHLTVATCTKRIFFAQSVHLMARDGSGQLPYGYLQFGLSTWLAKRKTITLSRKLLLDPLRPKTVSGWMKLLRKTMTFLLWWEPLVGRSSPSSIRHQFSPSLHSVMAVWLQLSHYSSLSCPLKNSDRIADSFLDHLATVSIQI